MPTQELNAYIDEAGDEGMTEGCSPWFIISAVVVNKEDDRAVANVVGIIKDRLWGEVNRQPLHWVRLQHDKKRVVIQEIGKQPFTLFAVALEKKYLNRERFDSRYDKQNRKKYRWAMYFYATRLLVERILLYASRQDALVNLIFENKSSMSYQDLFNYLTLITGFPDQNDQKSSNPRNLIKSCEPNNKEVKKLLQIADSCSGALYDALTINKYGLTEESYLEGIVDKFDRKDSQIWGYGLKVFPRNANEIHGEYGCYKWMKKI